MKKTITAASLRVLAAVMAVVALCAPAAWAAPTTVTGTVLDSEGLEVIGGMVEVKGTKTKVVTDINGVYHINVENPRKAVLVFSYLGSDPMPDRVLTKSPPSTWEPLLPTWRRKESRPI